MGHISRQGQAHARGMLVEAAHIAVRTPGPLRAFYLRVCARRGTQVAIVATARKLAVLASHMLSHGEDYRYGSQGRAASKLRALQLRANDCGEPITVPKRTEADRRGRSRRRLNTRPTSPAVLGVNPNAGLEFFIRTAVKKVPAPKVVTTLEATDSPLPPEIQEALGELVGAAREGLWALSVGVGLSVVHELMEPEVDEVVGAEGQARPGADGQAPRSRAGVDDTRRPAGGGTPAADPHGR